ncbi:hypothetical protein HMPREF9016_00146 [Neisseria sp. oral taxon 014 str. F0314]|nr:hypothetical protein HMPREF9016_00146 [Neisseria sp. oral taxon 014 str. F0314]
MKGRLKYVFRRPFLCFKLQAAGTEAQFFVEYCFVLWGRYYFDTFRKKAKEGENFKGNKNLNGNLGKSSFDTFRCKVGRN